MNFKDLFNDLKEIEKVENPEVLLEKTVKTILELQPIILNVIQMNELVYKMPVKADYNKVDSLIDHQYKEKEGQKVFEITVPIFNERNLSEYQVSLFNDFKNDCFPERGFYIVGDSKLIIEPFGLVKLEMNGLPYTRINSDFRYTRSSLDKEKGYREYLYFNFDYEKQEFINVYSDKLEECKRKMLQNPKALNDYHETVQEYINKETLLSAIKERIYPLSLPYLKKLKDWKESKYGDSKTGLTIGSITKYLDDYKKFIELDMLKSIKIKLVYGNITINEYIELLKKKTELSNQIKSAKDKLNEIKVMHSLNVESFNNYQLVVNSLFERETEITKDIEKVILPNLEKFKEVRSTSFPKFGLNEKTVLKGYIGYDLNKNEVYPNIMQLQRRSSLTEEKEDFRSEDEYIAQILNWFLQEKQD